MFGQIHQGPNKNRECHSRLALGRLKLGDEMFDPMRPEMVAGHVRPLYGDLVLLDGPEGIPETLQASAGIVNVPKQSGLNGGLPNPGDFPDQLFCARNIANAGLYVGGHAQRCDLARGIAHGSRLLSCCQEVTDALGRVFGPLRHLPRNAREPAAARLAPGGFSLEAPLDKYGGILPIALSMESVDGSRRQEDRRPFELIGSGPGHDPLRPVASFRPALGIVEEEQRGGEFCCQLEVARQGPLERRTQIPELVEDGVNRIGFFVTGDLPAQFPAPCGEHFAVPVLHHLEQARFIEFFTPECLNRLEHSE